MTKNLGEQMKTVNVLSLKGISVVTLLAASYATMAIVAWSNSRPAPARPQYPHGLSYGDVLRVTRVVADDVCYGD